VTVTRRLRGPEWAIGLTLFGAYAWFCQGGGWNQNSRFDQVRAVVETGRLSIDARMAANTGDLATAGGRLYPNKPPGTTLLALPAYALVSLLSTRAEQRPDDWWSATVALYLTTTLSVGALGAAGGALFYRLSRRMFPSIAPAPHAAAALTLGLSTLYFPFSTMLFDHVPVAFFSMLSLHLLMDEGEAAASPPATRPVAAGLAAGLAVLNNYSAAITAALLTLYAFAVCRPRRRALIFVSGGLPAALALAWYHQACFGRALTLATSYESEIFRQPEERWLGVFAAPDPALLVKLLVSPYRGLLFSSPVLALAGCGLWWMWTRRERRREAALCASIFACFLLLNASFNGWHGGYSYGPRYLIPALPFLALPLAPAFDRLPRLATTLACLSAAMTLLATAVDPQVPFDEPRPWSGYILPLAAGEEVVRMHQRESGPVSANPQTVTEKFAHDRFKPGSDQSRWASFNLGELVFGNSLASLLPLLILLAAGAWRVFADAGGAQGGRSRPAAGPARRPRAGRRAASRHLRISFLYLTRCGWSASAPSRRRRSAL
jgi:hypothetical protein